MENSKQLWYKPKVTGSGTAVVASVYYSHRVSISDNEIEITFLLVFHSCKLNNIVGGCYERVWRQICFTLEEYMSFAYYQEGIFLKGSITFAGHWQYILRDWISKRMVHQQRETIDMLPFCKKIHPSCCPSPS